MNRPEWFFGSLNSSVRAWAVFFVEIWRLQLQLKAIVHLNPFRPKLFTWFFLTVCDYHSTVQSVAPFDFNQTETRPRLLDQKIRYSAEDMLLENSAFEKIDSSMSGTHPADYQVTVRIRPRWRHDWRDELRTTIGDSAWFRWISWRPQKLLDSS